MSRASLIASMAVALTLGLPAHAEAPILTLSTAAPAPEITLTRSALAALPQHRLVTSTTVTDGQPVFEGFLMRDLLQAHGLEGEKVVARALNDYQVEIPLSDFDTFDVIGALYMDGEALSPRDKGPIWIVYPRDDHHELQDIRYDTRWVWQLVSLHVE